MDCTINATTTSESFISSIDNNIYFLINNISKYNSYFCTFKLGFNKSTLLNHAKVSLGLCLFQADLFYIFQLHFTKFQRTSLLYKIPRCIYTELNECTQNDRKRSLCPVNSYYTPRLS